MTTALEFLKEIPHLKQILDAEIALSYPRRKLQKKLQTSNTSARPISVFSPQTGKKIGKQNQTHSNILTSIFKQEKETNVHLINLLCLVHLKAQVML